jgi:hypothetical protein
MTHWSLIGRPQSDNCADWDCEHLLQPHPNRPGKRLKLINVKD